MSVFTQSIRYIRFPSAELKEIVPSLSSSLYKGYMGRVGVIGGSLEYTGAPYFAAEAALRFGADLSFVFCSPAAIVPIKCYSPELIVLPFVESVENSPSKVISRCHSIVLGPGLGRLPSSFSAAHDLLRSFLGSNSRYFPFSCTAK